jgi:hypothetical protein
VVPDVEGSNPSCRPSDRQFLCNLSNRVASANRMLRFSAFICFLAAAASLASAQTTLFPTSSSSSDQPINAKQRADWFALSTFGPESLAGGVISAGWGTLFNRPREYGTHWEGFGKRYGMRLTGVSVSNATEASIGAIWGEDPRYVRCQSESFGGRVGHVVKMTFVARNRQGQLRPAYARYIAIPGNNFISNAWRADSEATVGNASLRTVLGFVGRMSGNAFQEFWPDVRQHFTRK